MQSNQTPKHLHSVNEPDAESVVRAQKHAERKLNQKLDKRLIPALYLLCLVAFVDKIAIGNARIQGLEEDLHMDPKTNEFNIVLSLYWIPYILNQIPSNICMKLISPPIFFSVVTIIFGTAATCQGFVHNSRSLIACRLVLGFFEAGISPGSAYLLSMYYSRWELQKRYAILWTNGFVGGASSGLFAFVLAKMDGIGSFAGWRWIFIIEGLLTVVIGGVAYILLLDWPSSTKKLTAVEKEVLKTKMKDDGEKARMDNWNRQAIRRIVRDWKLYVGALQYCCMTVSSAALSFFMPTIIKEFGHSPSVAQVYTIPVWTACAIVTVVVGCLSDHLKKRAVFVYIGCGVTMLGYILLLCQGNLSTSVKYMSVIIMGTGVFTMQPLTVVWILNNISGHCKRSVGAALVLGFGNVGSIIASNIFISREQPKFQTGYGTSFAFIGLEVILCTGFLLGLKRENGKRERGERSYRLNGPLEEINNLGDDHPDFRFNY